MENKKEIRAFNFEIRASQNEEHGHFIEGRPIVFNRETDLGGFSEVIASGALDKTDLRDVRFLINHNFDMIPLARSRNNNSHSTMQMSVVPGEGMDIRVDLDTENNADARSLYSAIERGDITGMSFAFSVDKDSWTGMDTDHPTRSIDAISRVMEVSAVTWPAYEQTFISARADEMALESVSSVLESAKAEQQKENEERDRKVALLKLLLEV